MAGLAFGGVYLKRVADYQRAVRETVIQEVDLTRVADGTYTGEYDVGLVYARVEVTVAGGVITDVRILEHKNGRGGPAEAVTGAIVDQQRIGVDAVTGATNSSTVLKKAVENALRQGLRPESRPLYKKESRGRMSAAPAYSGETAQISPWATMVWETFKKPAMLAPTTRSPGTPHSREAS